MRTPAPASGNDTGDRKHLVQLHVTVRTGFVSSPSSITPQGVVSTER